MDIHITPEVKELHRKYVDFYNKFVKQFESEQFNANFDDLTLFNKNIKGSSDTLRDTVITSDGKVFNVLKLKQVKKKHHPKKDLDEDGSDDDDDDDGNSNNQNDNNKADHESDDETDSETEAVDEAELGEIEGVQEEISEVYGTLWTRGEKEAFFTGLARYSIHDITSIKGLLPKKSETQIYNYYNLLKNGHSHLRHKRNQYKKLMKYSDMPIAFEMDEFFVDMEEVQSTLMKKIEFRRNKYHKRTGTTQRFFHRDEFAKISNRVFHENNLPELRNNNKTLENSIMRNYLDGLKPRNLPPLIDAEATDVLESLVYAYTTNIIKKIIRMKLETTNFGDDPVDILAEKSDADSNNTDHSNTDHETANLNKDGEIHLKENYETVNLKNTQKVKDYLPIMDVSYSDVNRVMFSENSVPQLDNFTKGYLHGISNINPLFLINNKKLSIHKLNTLVKTSKKNSRGGTVFKLKKFKYENDHDKSDGAVAAKKTREMKLHFEYLDLNNLGNDSPFYKELRETSINSGDVVKYIYSCLKEYIKKDNEINENSELITKEKNIILKKGNDSESLEDKEMFCFNETIDIFELSRTNKSSRQLPEQTIAEKVLRLSKLAINRGEKGGFENANSVQEEYATTNEIGEHINSDSAEDIHFEDTEKKTEAESFIVDKAGSLDNEKLMDMFSKETKNIDTRDKEISALYQRMIIRYLYGYNLDENHNLLSKVADSQEHNETLAPFDLDEIYSNSSTALSENLHSLPTAASKDLSNFCEVVCSDVYPRQLKFATCGESYLSHKRKFYKGITQFKRSLRDDIEDFQVKHLKQKFRNILRLMEHRYSSTAKSEGIDFGVVRKDKSIYDYLFKKYSQFTRPLGQFKTFSIHEHRYDLREDGEYYSLEDLEEDCELLKNNPRILALSNGTNEKKRRVQEVQPDNEVNNKKQKININAISISENEASNKYIGTIVEESGPGVKNTFSNIEPKESYFSKLENEILEMSLHDFPLYE